MAKLKIFSFLDFILQLFSLHLHSTRVQQKQNFLNTKRFSNEIFFSFLNIMKSSGFRHEPLSFFIIKVKSEQKFTFNNLTFSSQIICCQIFLSHKIKHFLIRFHFQNFASLLILYYCSSPKIYTPMKTKLLCLLLLITLLSPIFSEDIELTPEEKAKLKPQASHINPCKEEFPYLSVGDFNLTNENFTRYSLHFVLTLSF